MTTEEELLAQAAENRKLQLAELAKSNLPNDYSGEQIAGQAILGILPLLLGGAMGGKKGLHAGAVGSLTGQQSYLDRITKENEKEDALAKATAAIYGTEASRYQADASRLGIGKELNKDRYEYQDRLKRDHPPKGNQTNIYNQGDIYKEVGAKVDAFAGTAQSAQNAIDNILSIAPEEARKTYYDEKTGEVDYGKAASIIGDRLKAMGAGAESATGRVQMEINKFVSQYLKDMSGASATEMEAARKKAEIVGEGLIPASVPTILETLRSMQDDLEKRAITTINTHETLSAPGDKAEGVRKLFRERIRGGSGAVSTDVAPSKETPETIANLRKAAEANGVPKVVKVLNGKPTQVYDFGPDTPADKRWLTVE